MTASIPLHRTPNKPNSSKQADNIVYARMEKVNLFVEILRICCVSASNIGYTKARERSQGKGGDLRSKYNLTLTVVRKKYNGRGLFGKPCRTALDTLPCGAPAGFTT